MACIQTTLCCWAELLYGRACCLWNCVFAPCILTFWSCAIYCCGCLRVYAGRNARGPAFKDPNFQADSELLGVEEDVIWLRATRHARTKSLQLVEETETYQLCRSAVGESWLLSALACLMERGALHHLFETVEKNPRGRYVLRLFDGIEQEWQRIIIDDRVPCQRDAYEASKSFKPIFLRTKDRELYLLLIEKAFAKFLGGYQHLDGRSTAWALSVMTGDPARIFVREEETWARKELEDEMDKSGARNFTLVDTGAKLSSDVFFEVLKKYCLLQSALCAAGASAGSGLHRKHAYCILDARKVGGGESMRRFVKLRNAWPGRWLGELAFGSSAWQERQVREALEYDEKDESVLWMSWDEFLSTWRTVAVVDLPAGIQTLRLEVSGGSPLAPAAACLSGCCSFWCGGCQTLYCPFREIGAGKEYSVRRSCGEPGMIGRDLEKE